MPTEAKRETVQALSECFKKAQAVFIGEYRGLTVAKMTQIRRNIRKAGGEMKVAKNTLVRLALKEAGYPLAEGIDTGPNVYTVAYDDVAGVAKALRDFSKEKGNEALTIKGGIMGSKVLNAAQVHAIADLPPREVLLAQLLGTLVGPIRGLVTVLSGPSRGLVTALTAIKDQKEKAA